MGINYNPRIVTDGLVLCLDAGNPRSYPGSGNTWSDLSGRGNNGTLSNGVSYDSTNGGAFVFDGVDDTIVATNFASPPNTKYTLFADSTRTWSISSWFLPTLPGVNTTTFAAITAQTFLVTASAATYAVWIPPNTTILRTRLRNGTVVDITTSLQSTWNEVAVTWDGTIGKAYLNGSYVSDIVPGVANNLTNNPLYIGGSQNGNNYTGKVSSTKVYLKALTASEITQNFAALRGRYGI
jgi:hypothetical protein